MKKIAYTTALAVGFLGLVLPSFAATYTPSATVVSCVATAVNTREQALGAGISVYTQAVASAYSTRSNALKQAWAGTTWSQINPAVKTAWSQFRASIKSTRTAWKNTRQAAWKQFNTATKACKASGTVTATEASGQGAEVSGQ